MYYFSFEDNIERVKHTIESIENLVEYFKEKPDLEIYISIIGYLTELSKETNDLCINGKDYLINNYEIKEKVS